MKRIYSGVSGKALAGLARLVGEGREVWALPCTDGRFTVITREVKPGY